MSLLNTYSLILCLKFVFLSPIYIIYIYIYTQTTCGSDGAGDAAQQPRAVSESPTASAGTG